MEAAADNHAALLPCAKYDRYQDRRDPRCSDPELYCKHRSACLIHFMEKSQRRRDEDK